MPASRGLRRGGTVLADRHALVKSGIPDQAHGLLPAGEPLQPGLVDLGAVLLVDFLTSHKVVVRVSDIGGGGGGVRVSHFRNLLFFYGSRPLSDYDYTLFSENCNTFRRC